MLAAAFRRLAAALGMLAAGLVLLTATSAAKAQGNWSEVAVPAYDPAHLLQGLHRYWTLPQSHAFADQARLLGTLLEAYCKGPAPAADTDIEAVRQQWRASAAAWDRLSAVAVGPLLERRASRRIDFTPTRPALIERAVKASPRGADAMELIGTPAKGLPALEWLLWTRPAQPATSACAYAVEVARDVEREAAALLAAFEALADRPTDAWSDEATAAGVDELVNQWVGGLERLRWARMEKPLRAENLKELPRSASGTTAASWAAQWSTLKSLARFAADVAPAPGQGLVPIETYLRGRGLNALADRLAQSVQSADDRVRAATPAAPASVFDAAREIGALKRLAEAELAPALDVRIGFSDADGD